MTKVGNNDKMFRDAVDIGRKNKDLIPRVQNWCRNLNIKDVSSGLVAENYKLPLTLHLSCPHLTSSVKGMGLELMAQHFILDNCLSCKFHDEINKSNFGRHSLEKRRSLKEKLAKSEKEYNETKQALTEQIEELIFVNKSKTEVTELSVLKLIQSIENSRDQKKIAQEILEASKLSPIFFGDIALDYLSLYFDSEEIGVEILVATQNILRAGKQLPSQSFDRLAIIIEKGEHVDENAGILKLLIEGGSIKNYEIYIRYLMESLWYMRDIGDPYDSRSSFPNCISLFAMIFKQDSKMLFNLINERLEINDKTTRINTTYVLQELMIANSSIVLPHCATIIKTLEYEDDSFNESADRNACTTIAQLYLHYPTEVLFLVYKLYPTLTDGAKIELLNFYKIILLEDGFLTVDNDNIEGIIANLIQITFGKEISKDLREAALQILEDVSRSRPILLSNSFEVMLGSIMTFYEEFRTFEYYRNELEQQNDKISTFNPLLGKNIYEVDLERMATERAFGKAETIVENLILNNRDNSCYISILSTISNLESSTKGLLKSRLIRLIIKTANDPIFLSEQLPSIYKFLFDTDSIEVRCEAIDFIIFLIEKHSQIVTHTLTDIIKVFMSDVDRLVQAKAFEAFGAIIKQFPNEVEKDQIHLVLKSITNQYVITHKSAARLSYKIFPLLDSKQKSTLITTIIQLENSYSKEKDFRFCKELVNILLFATMENTVLYSRIVHNYVGRYCDSKEYEKDLDFLKKLTHIRNQKDEFNKIWLAKSLGFLYRTNSDYHSRSFDFRKDLLNTLYKIPKNIIVEQLETIQKLVSQKINDGNISDVFELYSVFCYFRLYEPLQELSRYFDENIQNNESNKSAIQLNNKHNVIANMELKVSKKQLDINFINSINY